MQLYYATKYMLFEADLHVHSDSYIDIETGKRHGETPEEIAFAVVQQNLDAVAITDHSEYIKGKSDEIERIKRCVDVEIAIGKLTEGTKRKILCLLGNETSFRFGNVNHHINYIFEEGFDLNDFPPMLPTHLSITELELFREKYPGIVFLCHPALKLKPHSQKRAKIVEELMASGLVDGIEIFNGSMLSNGVPAVLTRRGVEMLLGARSRGVRLAGLGCSDAHRQELVGSAVTAFRGKSPADIFTAVREAETHPVIVSQKARDRARGVLHNMEFSI